MSVPVGTPAGVRSHRQKPDTPGLGVVKERRGFVGEGGEGCRRLPKACCGQTELWAEEAAGAATPG